MPSNDNQDWLNDHKLIQYQLEQLMDASGKLQQDLTDFKINLVRFDELSRQVAELATWKKEREEMLSNKSLGELVKDVKTLNTFRIRTITILITLQTIVNIGVVVLSKFL